MENAMDQESVTIAVQALWLQYHGLTIESVSVLNCADNAAWKKSPPAQADEIAMTGLMIAN